MHQSHPKTVFIIVLVALSICGFKPRATSSPDHTATLINVIDGDTIYVRFNNGTGGKIRLIGVDTPETRDNQKLSMDVKRSHESSRLMKEAGACSSEFLETLLDPFETLKIEYDTKKYDKYERRLAYVFNSRGQMLNIELLRAGYASLECVKPNTKRCEQFARVEEESRRENRGLWRVNLLPKHTWKIRK